MYELVVQTTRTSTVLTFLPFTCSAWHFGK